MSDVERGRRVIVPTTGVLSEIPELRASEMAREFSATDIGALDLLVAAAKHKKPILAASTAAAVLALLVSLLVPNIYTSTTRILPPQQSQSAAAAMLGQLAPLASLAGRDLGLKNPNDIYVAMLESRRAGDALIGRFELMRHYGCRSMQKAREELAKRTFVVNGKDGIISVSYDDEDPRQSAAISNAYVEELSNISRSLAVTEAAQRRLFYENQLRAAKEQLSASEAALRSTQESTGLIEPGAQARAIIDAVANLRAQISIREVELQAMSAFATRQNPDYERLRREIGGLRGQLVQLESDQGNRRRGDLQVATEKVPQVGMEYLRGYRDVKYHETIFELIAKQYEIAKIDEGRDANVIQVLDPAIPPEKKSRPQRLAIALIAFLSTAAAGVLVAIFCELPLLSDEQREKWRLVKNYLRIARRAAKR